ncbi:protein prenyltransferase alpha subunit repeat-containing protein 1 isoform X2 [Aquila chrysaetos chrysaetos]|uniref:protein prenyltransferase alpha subunit repeat-containing protein 1 isoform X2 n=1 Tax=Aquila chrysaetos chrysaetos TaxID=223781 RepID=UPI00117663AF|nr:protein prenyltransferase alpha subunit repeat-containing protein 1 isoform X2 [Aquila chrysaetos chrysaetos]
MAESPEEVAVLVQRVVKDIRNAFQRNPHIDEIGLIPCPEARYNRSPIVLVENKLGVESWCVKFLLPYVHNKLVLYRQRRQWLNKDELIDITCTLLLLNPDFTTAWNVRKELILSGTLNPLKDLHLGKLALTKFPKSPETWIHRRWVLQQLIQENSLPSLVTKGNLGAAPVERIHRLVQEEMNVCSEAAGRYPSNYNAWSHRIWVLQHLGKLTVKVLLDELSSTKYWVSMHVSDHSGFHYRQFLLKSLIGRTVTDSNVLVQNQIINEQNPSLQKEEESAGAEAACAEEQSVDLPRHLEEELELCTELIDSYPGHETLWCHRCVFYLQHHLSNKIPLLSAVVSSVDSSDETLNNSHHSPATSPMAQAMDVDGLNESSSKQGYTQETKRLKRAPMQDSFGPEVEYQFIDKVLSTCRDADQARFATAYRKWLVTFLGQ